MADEKFAGDIRYDGLTAFQDVANLLAAQAQDDPQDSARDTDVVRTERRAALNPQIPTQQEQQLTRREFNFSGAMILDTEPLNGGFDNYADLQNMRYANRGLKGVQGYTQVNQTTALVAEPEMRSGVQFYKNINGVNTSHILVQSENAGGTTSSVYRHDTAVPGVGDFNATALHVDPANAGLGRFALIPDGNVAYCNTDEALIWGSDEHRVAAVVNWEDVADGWRKDITDRVINTQQNAANSAVLDLDGTTVRILVGATRALQGIKFYVGTVNTGASTAAVEYWDGSSWTSVGGFSDGTSSGGASLGQTGTMSFNDTSTVARARIEDERMLYFYRITISGTPDATISIYHVTVDANIQGFTDVWDGVYRSPIGFIWEDRENGNPGTQFNKGSDYTLEVQEPSTIASPIGAQLGEWGTADLVYIGFTERMTAIRWKMASDRTNDRNSSMELEYWNGTAWTSVSGFVDETEESNETLNRSGLMYWDAPSFDSEFQTSIEGTQAYWYRFSVTDDFDDELDSVIADQIIGIPAQLFDKDRTMGGYRFAFGFRGRVMLCNRTTGNEVNRIDYCATGAPDVWNGEDSSALGKSIYVGDGEPLSAAAELINRFGENLSAHAVILKENQTWLLTGSGPDDFRLLSISQTVGCPAPLTLTIADVPFAVDARAIRNVAMFVSHKGPMMFDGTVLRPMRFQQPDGSISSIDAYFDRSDSRFIETDLFERAVGWFDAQFDEYNILIPSGSGATDNNAWLVCDMKRQKWFRKVPSAYPQMGFVVREVEGAQHVYGGLNTGRMMHLENSNSWDGSNIAHVVRTTDMIIAGTMWSEAILRFIRVTTARETGDNDSISVTHSIDGAESFSALTTLDLLSTTSERWRRVTKAISQHGWSHQFEFTISTDDKAVAPRLINWGILYGLEHEGNYDSIDNLIGQGSTGPNSTT
jgi:hypothetical protein